MSIVYWIRLLLNDESPRLLNSAEAKDNENKRSRVGAAILMRFMQQRRCTSCLVTIPLSHWQLLSPFLIGQSFTIQRSYS